MQAQERLKKVVETLKTEPIEILSAETWTIGWALFWRQAILFAPGYALAIWEQLDARSLERALPNSPWLLPGLVVFLLYYALTLGAAETWRTKNLSVALSFAAWKSTLKRGASLWWRTFAGMVRVVWVAFVFALLSLALSKEGADVLVLVVVFALLVPSMGFGTRHWLRGLRVDAEAEGRSLVSAGVCNLCGLPMDVSPEGGASTVSVPRTNTVRRWCARCDVTSVETRQR